MDFAALHWDEVGLVDGLGDTGCGKFISRSSAPWA
jgi:hypothetical protein